MLTVISPSLGCAVPGFETRAGPERDSSVFDRDRKGHLLTRLEVDGRGRVLRRARAGQTDGGEEEGERQRSRETTKFGHLWHRAEYFQRIIDLLLKARRIGHDNTGYVAPQKIQPSALGAPAAYSAGNSEKSLAKG